MTILDINNNSFYNKFDYNVEKAVEALKKEFGQQFSISKSVREQHTSTTTVHTPELPDGVVFAYSKEDVQKTVKICHEHGCPIIPFGAGSSLEGHLNANFGGISIDMNNLNNIIEVHPEDSTVVVQPGVTREQLNTYLRDTGLFFPIDPGANASIGGMTSTRASGTNAVRYGTMKDNVLSLEVVMPNGEIIKTASRARKSSAGYDLTRLIVGSEGTLGVITEITLKLYGIPEEIGAGRCTFPSVKDATDAVIMTIQAGIPVARIELLDIAQVKAVNNYSKLSLPESPLLLLEFHGSKSSVKEQSELFNEISKDFGGNNFEWNANIEERNKLWKARHDVYYSVKALGKNMKVYSTDICVPISKLVECVSWAEKHVKDNGLIAPMVGHVGDGNFHSIILYDPQDKEKQKLIREYSDKLIEKALELEGTITGEHGIGLQKKGYLLKEHPDNLPVMKSIKRSLDANNIMNPGKVFDIN